MGDLHKFNRICKIYEMKQNLSSLLKSTNSDKICKICKLRQNLYNQTKSVNSKSTKFVKSVNCDKIYKVRQNL